MNERQESLRFTGKARGVKVTGRYLRKADNASCLFIVYIHKEMIGQKLAADDRSSHRLYFFDM